MYLRKQIFAVFSISIVLCVTSHSQSYTWLGAYDGTRTISTVFDQPRGYEQVKTEAGSFGHWLRNLPLKRANALVYLYDGSHRTNQNTHVAVIDIDTGDRDLQQCADAFMRLRAEFFYSRQEYDSIAFNFTSGDRASFRNWINGIRPIVSGTNVRWTQSANVDSSYNSFKKYLDTVFMYAGSYSYRLELTRKKDPCEIEIGDLFVIGGFPGHLVFVVNVAFDKSTDKRIFLLAQGFTPAQDIHILKNPRSGLLSPWYDCDFGKILKTPEWTFKREHLMTLE